MASVSGGDRLKAALKKVEANLSKAKSVEIGFIDGRTYPDGQSVATIAKTQEFGGAINVPEHEVEIYRKLDSEGDLANDGRFVKRKQSNFATTHTVPAHTINIPPRPFFRNMLAKEEKNINVNLRTALKNNNYDAEKALDLVGQHLRDRLMDSIQSNTPPPNAKSTIRGKGGSTQTLIHSGLMLNSVTHEVK